MKTSLLTLLICFVTLIGTSQGLTLKSPNQEKTFDAESLLEIHLREPDNQLKDDCNNWKLLLGNLTSVTEDSLSMQLYEYEEHLNIDGVKVQNTLFSTTGTNTYSFSKKNVYELRSYKNTTHKKRKRNLSVFGGIGIFTGLLTTASSLALKDKPSREMIALIGLGQIGLGITFSSMGHRKKYKVKGAETIWRVQ